MFVTLYISSCSKKLMMIGIITFFVSISSLFSSSSSLLLRVEELVNNLVLGWRKNLV